MKHLVAEFDALRRRFPAGFESSLVLPCLRRIQEDRGHVADTDIDALAANLLRLLDDPALRTQFGEYGRSRVEEHFTPQRMASDFAALYARMLE